MGGCHGWQRLCLRKSWCSRSNQLLGSRRKNITHGTPTELWPSRYTAVGLYMAHMSAYILAGPRSMHCFLDRTVNFYTVYMITQYSTCTYTTHTHAHMHTNTQTRKQAHRHTNAYTRSANTTNGAATQQTSTWPWFTFLQDSAPCTLCVPTTLQGDAKKRPCTHG